MFDETLLESSPSRVPVLTGKHWLISLAIGVVVFLALFFGLPVLSFGAETKVVVAQAVIGAVLVTAYALMCCYVASDARRLNLGWAVWLVITLLFNIVGFIAYLIYSAIKTDNWKRATIPLAYMIEIVIVGVLVLVPLIYTEALPSAQLMTFLAAPPPPPPPPPPPAAAAPVVKVKRVTVEDIMKAPTVIPKTVKIIKDAPEPVNTGAVGVVGGVPGGVPGGTAGGVIGGIIGSMPSAAPPPPPVKKEEQKITRIRVGGNVQQANLIRKITPVYPALAKQARVQGQVRFTAIIGRDGAIQNLQVISGHPLLIPAAQDAVRQWQYRPTLLNGEPVEVVTQIDVNFTLSN